MIHKVRGIVFHSLKYAETSLIARIYTDKFGLQSYMIKGARKPRAKLKASLFQPLTLLELEVYHKDKSSLQNIREARTAYVFSSTPFDIRKSSVTMFLSDLLTKTIKEEEANPGLFQFLDVMIQKLDQLDDGIADFHLHFMVHLTRYLGFFPQGKCLPHSPYFNLEEGSFTKDRPHHMNFITSPLNEQFSILMHKHPSAPLALDINRGDRNQLLEHLISYYLLHYDSLQEIQSHHVLREIFDNT